MKVQCASIKLNIREVHCENMDVKRKQTQGLRYMSGEQVKRAHLGAHERTLKKCLAPS